jgi:hypothetical protein
MGYGVPFITRSNAITGGEIFNVTNGATGILYEHGSELTDIIADIASHPEKYIKMGVKAKEHYDSNRKPVDMANGLSDAIEYVLKNRKND